MFRARWLVTMAMRAGNIFFLFSFWQQSFVSRFYAAFVRRRAGAEALSARAWRAATRQSASKQTSERAKQKRNQTTIAELADAHGSNCNRQISLAIAKRHRMTFAVDAAISSPLD